MKPNISEFSYGYALTDELIHWHGSDVTAAPVFPSLHAEGKKGGGYDLKLEKGGIPLFLQFKLADRMVRDNAKEVKDGHFTCPFFRMHLRPARHSNQHEMLLELEGQGEEVWYSAPAFHDLEELNDAYLNHQVRERSMWIKPSTIGTLEDAKDHHVAFTVPGSPMVCSNPRRINDRVDLEKFESDIERALKARRTSAVTNERLSALADTLYSVGSQRREVSAARKIVAHQELSQRAPLERVAFFASMLFGAQFFIVTYRD